MPASNTIVLKSLSILLGLFFIFVGTLKLTPHISKDLYKDLVSGKIDSVGTGALFTMRRAALSSIFSRSERERNPHINRTTNMPRNKFTMLLSCIPLT